ncbi:molybdate ABC transporter substrate-binding protein [Shewanella avicenniae]|uniref:Molybdate ABC transporter substrate-binding protein n=1 Tax=Shewanella avicenniae TaxID=2814294 RepID=A0ABX7QRD2_9GAMM|nr:molybdate ABC transporter substrate-binding protein [Shewanella avicenniae]QSX33829.1 molybdate ABC transporter substrate-binding protein [Shewanella avicenniae]
MRLLLLLCGLLSFTVVADEARIAAAANIKFAMQQIVENYQQDTGAKVRVSYGSSGNFVSQLSHGAPFELFLSADEKYVTLVEQAGLTADSGIIYAYGKLALVASNNSSLALDPQLDGLKQALSQGKIKRFAIANPDHAPYGEKARELLTNKGLWQSLQPKLVFGENVSQAAQFAMSGSTDGGIVALSLAVAPEFKQRGRYLAIPESEYSPLAQRMVLMKGASEQAKNFYQYLQSERARQVFSDFGFGLPDKR